jgi:hypothetical protein
MYRWNLFQRWKRSQQGVIQQVQGEGGEKVKIATVTEVVRTAATTKGV